MMPNVVQVEFMHIGSGDSLGNLHREYIDRLQDYAPMKTTLRFFDEGSVVTEFVTRYERAQKKLYRYSDMYRSLPAWKKPVIALLMQYELNKGVSSQRRLKEACEALEAIAYTSCEIAVEQSDRSFRPIHRNELYEILTAVRMAKGAWIFVFEPNDLYADVNTIIARAM